MSSYSKYVEGIVEHETENRIISARDLYEQKCKNIPEMSFYKTIERMNKKGSVVHLAKGLYYRPQKTKYGIVPISDEIIIDYYTNNYQGVVVGYRLCSRLGLTTQLSKKVEILSSNITENKKKIGNIYVVNKGICFTKKNIPVIETLEILQNYKKFEDFNYARLGEYMKNFSFSYSDVETVTVIKQGKYKKSTTALLRDFLNYWDIKNSLNQFLSSLSKYEIPEMSCFYDNSSLDNIS